ncbi:MAG: hypothetical protein ACI8ZF_000214 [Candidatus Midichloriaceae bacterium]|jgi:hypothetical protein
MNKLFNRSIAIACVAVAVVFNADAALKGKGSPVEGAKLPSHSMYDVKSPHRAMEGLASNHIKAMESKMSEFASSASSAHSTAQTMYPGDLKAGSTINPGKELQSLKDLQVSLKAKIGSHKFGDRLNKMYTDHKAKVGLIKSTHDARGTGKDQVTKLAYDTEIAQLKSDIGKLELKVSQGNMDTNLATLVSTHASLLSTAGTALFKHTY